MKLAESVLREVHLSESHKVVVKYTYAGEIRKFMFSFKNRTIGYRWHWLIVEKEHWDCWVASPYTPEGKDTTDIFLSGEDFCYLCLSKNLSFLDDKLNLTPLDSFSK